MREKVRYELEEQMNCSFCGADNDGDEAAIFKQRPNCAGIGGKNVFNLFS
ncbi:unnamed protein product [Enterobius vermicularis]|uniref:ClpX-type ZB domain-containing protein n=1 Tax=Enterobius vermicularis TaxID=51028 RepID=A0A0N4V3X1_ENTVE|nr:unnamed protein product [Enterobius vermicularis]